MTLTDSDLQRAKELCEAATPGPWEADIDSRFGTIEQIQRLRPNGWIDPVIVASTSKVVSFEDAEFIAASRTLVPQLLDLVEAQRKEIAELRDSYDYLSACAIERGECE